MLCLVDHFEPANGMAGARVQQERVKAWVEGYPKFADTHRDADGRAPQHTWFYPPHHDTRFLQDLTELCKNGYGEIEMHLHHNHMEPFPDTPETLRIKIMQCVEDYSRYGIFCLPDGSKRFAFIHGDWSLDNARGSQFCGINNEINILSECGCYADFTFPSLGRAQPAMVNKFYYAKDDPGKPKSYNRGREVRVKAGQEEGLLMVTGILGLRWKSTGRRPGLSIEASNLDDTDYAFEERIDYWVNNGTKIPGKENWVFIKLHTHGAREDAWGAMFGSKAENMFRYLEEKYNDRKKYFLHYTTAREMFNLIKSVEAGMVGEPNTFRDYLVSPYIYSRANL